MARLGGVDTEVLGERLVLDQVWEQFEVGRVTEREFCCHLREACGLTLTDEELIFGWNSTYIGVNGEWKRSCERLPAKASALLP